MKLSEVKFQLDFLEKVEFQLPNGDMIPKHFHVTEVGVITKNFIDCGGVVRNEKVANFQLWEANDFDHSLAPQKLNDIISLSVKTLGMEDLEVEVEYQSDTIGKYGLDFENGVFQLVAKQTDCLAKDNCGIPEEQLNTNACAPGSGCC